MPIKKKLFSAPVVLAFGSGAGKILSKMPLSSEFYKVAVNSSERDLSMIESKVDLLIRCGSGMGSGMSPEQGRKDLDGKLSHLFGRIDEVRKETKVKDIDLIPLIATLGHGFGTGSLELALSVIKDKYKDALLVPIVITPFTWEGRAVVDRAYKALAKACKVNTCFVISNEEVGTIYKDIGLSYEKTNVLIGNLISVVVRAFSTTDGVLQTVDKSDLSKFLSGELATMRHLRLKSASELKTDTVDKSLGPRWLKTGFKPFKPSPPQLRVFYIIDGRGPLTPTTLESIHDLILDKDYINGAEVKPLLISRNKDLDFVWMESGFSLACGRNIYGVY